MGLRTGPPPVAPGRSRRSSGEGCVDSEGYARIQVRGRGRRVHRLVMEVVLGRALAEEEDVHHRDGNRLHNCPPNLQVMTHDHHTWHHLHVLPLVGYCEQCGEPYLQKVKWGKPRRFCSFGCYLGFRQEHRREAEAGVGG
jgi:hypothetical protein